MPKLKPETELARRQHILDAAERCFGRGGFHATTMQDICKEAAVSPGAVYVYFDSKEALIAGLCERNQTELAERTSKLSEAPDFLAALSAIGESYFIDDPVARQRVVVETSMEAARNPRVAEIYFGTEKYVADMFGEMFTRLKAEGRIDPVIDIPTLTKVFMVIGDGLFWRRAALPGFDVRDVLPVLTQMIGALVRPVEVDVAPQNAKERAEP